MSIDLNRLPDMSVVMYAINQGEGQQIEFKAVIPSALEVAKEISGFANASGGWLIVGVRERAPAMIVGCDWNKLAQVYEQAIQRLTNASNVKLHHVDMHQKSPVGVIVVKPSKELVVTDAGAFVRQADKTVPMQKEQVLARMHEQPQGGRDEQSASDIARLTATVDELMEKFDASQTWGGQWKALWVGTAGSTLSTIIVALVLLIVGLIAALFYK
jgi:predicted HTH transcriptional regulator